MNEYGPTHRTVAGEAPPRQPFWVFNHPGDEFLVTRVLAERFPDAYQRLQRALEAADPMDVVYPGNPNEYSDVLREALVLLAPENGVLLRISRDRLHDVLREALAKCFGEPADDERLRAAVELALVTQASTETDRG